MREAITYATATRAKLPGMDDREPTYASERGDIDYHISVVNGDDPKFKIRYKAG